MNATYTMINAEDAAKRLGVSKQTLYQWIKKGYVRATNIGDGVKKPRWQVRDTDLEDAIATKKDHYHKRKTSVEAPVIEVTEEDYKTIMDTKLDHDPALLLKVLTEVYQENHELRERVKQLEKDRSQLANEILEVLVKHN